MKDFYYSKASHELVYVPAGESYEKEGFVKLVPNTVDAAREKHVPVIEVEGKKVVVKVGEVEHPMTDVHYISHIVLETSEGVRIAEKKPGEKPVAEFVLKEGEKPLAAYEYCTLHGFWKKEA